MVIVTQCKGVKSTLDPCCKLLQELVMSRPLRIQFPDAWYHVMNRGRRGEKVFEGKNDYNAFIDLLKELVEDFNVEKHGCQAYTVDREPQKQISKSVSDLDLSNV